MSYVRFFGGNNWNNVICDPERMVNYAGGPRHHLCPQHPPATAYKAYGAGISASVNTVLGRQPQKVQIRIHHWRESFRGVHGMFPIPGRIRDLSMGGCHVPALGAHWRNLSKRKHSMFRTDLDGQLECKGAPSPCKVTAAHCFRWVDKGTSTCRWVHC